MPDIKFTVPVSALPSVVDALCWRGGYQAKALNENNEEINNPVSKAEFARKQIMIMVQNVVTDYKNTKALEVSAAENTPINLT
jgi:hypothetical protein